MNNKCVDALIISVVGSRLVGKKSFISRLLRDNGETVFVNDREDADRVENDREEADRVENDREEADRKKSFISRLLRDNGESVFVNDREEADRVENDLEDVDRVAKERGDADRVEMERFEVDQGDGRYVASVAVKKNMIFSGIVLVIFDVTNKVSFALAQKRVLQCKSSNPGSDSLIYLLGNKSDDDRAAVRVHDVANFAQKNGAVSFALAQKRVLQCKSSNPGSDSLIYLLGNKSDADRAAVRVHDVATFARKNGAVYMEISSKSGHNVDAVMDAIFHHRAAKVRELVESGTKLNVHFEVELCGEELEELMDYNDFQKTELVRTQLQLQAANELIQVQKRVIESLKAAKQQQQKREMELLKKNDENDLGANDLGAKDRGAKDRGAKNRRAKDRGAYSGGFAMFFKEMRARREALKKVNELDESFGEIRETSFELDELVEEKLAEAKAADLEQVHDRQIYTKSMSRNVLQ
uniref:Uncharacterized protein n=1 Tax=Panagrolaimus sp. ES5 TaxID=591445 RepID=A0AC34G2A2_9BILA